MKNQIRSVGSEQLRGKVPDRKFHNEPDDPNNPNEARERFEREEMEQGKMPGVGSL